MNRHKFPIAVPPSTPYVNDGLFLGFIPLSVHPLQQQDALKIYEADKKITIDGNLEDGEGIKEIPIDLSTAGDKIEPSQGLAVTARFTYDAKNFYAAVKAVDDVFEFPNRSWRYGASCPCWISRSAA